MAEDALREFGSLQIIGEILLTIKGSRQAHSSKPEDNHALCGKLRLSDLEKAERQKAEHQTALSDGNMTFADALAMYRERLNSNAGLKPRSKVHRKERIAALLKSWRELDWKEVRKISKQECLNWAERLALEAAPSNFNNTTGTLRQILDIAVEAGAIYDNPAEFIKRQRVRAKKLQLPSREQFQALNEAIQNADGGWNLNPKAKFYIGVKEKDIKQAREKVEEVLRDGVDYIEMEKPETDEFTRTE